MVMLPPPAARSKAPVPLKIVQKPGSRGVKTIRIVPFGQVITRSIKPSGFTPGSLPGWTSRTAPPAQNGEPPSTDPSSTLPVAIGSTRSASAMVISVRITIDSPIGLGLAAAADAEPAGGVALVSAVPRARPLHATATNIKIVAGTIVLRLSRDLCFDAHRGAVMVVNFAPSETCPLRSSRGRNIVEDPLERPDHGGRLVQLDLVTGAGSRVQRAIGR